MHPNHPASLRALLIVPPTQQAPPLQSERPVVSTGAMVQVSTPATLAANKSIE